MSSFSAFASGGAPLLSAGHEYTLTFGILNIGVFFPQVEKVNGIFQIMCIFPWGAPVSVLCQGKTRPSECVAILVGVENAVEIFLHPSVWALIGVLANIHHVCLAKIVFPNRY